MNTMTDLTQEYRALVMARRFLDDDVEISLRSLPYAVAAPIIANAKDLADRLQKIIDEIAQAGDAGHTITRERHIPLSAKGFAPELFGSDA